MPKIIARLVGGIGNQLFIYATAKRIAERNSCELVIDDVTGFINDRKYKRTSQLDKFSISGRSATAAERREPFHRIRRKISRWISSWLQFERRRHIVQEGNIFDERLLTLDIKNDIYLEGYWQSEKYFQDIKDIIRCEFQISAQLDADVRELGAQMRANFSVAVHFRYFEYPDLNSKSDVPVAYYDRAFDELRKRFGNNVALYVFSEYPDIACRNIPEDFKNLRIVKTPPGDDRAYVDLWLMSQCQHFVISNSTFAWWAAWLGEKLESIVICPGPMKSHQITWGYYEMLPERWISLKV